MDNGSRKVVVAQMKPRERHEWKQEKSVLRRRRRRINKRLLRKYVPLAAVVLCLGAGGAAAALNREGVSAVMSHLSAGFEYDETLGRLQFVSNILPESAMVFLSGGDETQAVALPADGEVAHVWSQDEPWLEYACTGDVSSCMDGEVMTVVRNRQDEYTVRVLHAGGYESVYSGLDGVSVAENSLVSAGQKLGTSSGFAAFELRRDGLSVLPVFAGR